MSVEIEIPRNYPTVWYRRYLREPGRMNGKLTLDHEFFINYYRRYIEQKYQKFWKLVHITDEEFSKNLEKALIYRPRAITGTAMFNTAIEISLPSPATINGSFDILYNRMVLPEYFKGFGLSMLPVPSGLGSTTPVVIDYHRWVKAVHGSTVRDLIHSEMTYNLGKTFYYDGGIFDESWRRNPTDSAVEFHTPLAVIYPNIKTIENAWRYREFIHNDPNEPDVEYLTIYLKLVADGHVFIEDGIMYIPVQLKRKLVRYTTMNEGVV